MGLGGGRMPNEKKDPTIVELMGPTSKKDAKKWRKQERQKQEAILKGLRKTPKPD